MTCLVDNTDLAYKLMDALNKRGVDYVVRQYGDGYHFCYSNKEKDVVEYLTQNLSLFMQIYSGNGELLGRFFALKVEDETNNETASYFLYKCNYLSRFLIENEITKDIRESMGVDYNVTEMIEINRHVIPEYIMVRFDANQGPGVYPVSIEEDTFSDMVTDTRDFDGYDSENEHANVDDFEDYSTEF